MDRFEKLPVWAKDEITRLTRLADDRFNDIILLKGDISSKTNVENFGESPRPLGDHATISFKLNDGGIINCSLSLNGNAVRIATGYGNSAFHAVSITPVAGSCFLVKAVSE